MQQLLQTGTGVKHIKKHISKGHVQHMTHFKRSAVNPNVNSVSQKVFSSNTPLSPLSHLLHLCFLSNLRPARASSLSASGDVLTGRKYPLSLKPNQRLSHPHSLFFSETPTTATCSAFPIPHPPLRRPGPPILPPTFSRLRLFSRFLTKSLCI